MALSISERLMYYKREDIRQAMAEGATDKEVAVKYGEHGFGKRPDIITSPGDILEIAKKGATSFHTSEEIWTNPMQLSPNLSKKELDALRKGWDMVLDIDCPYWEFAKLTAKLMIKALSDNGVKKSVSIKFSGNKGFHVGVPFEAFPQSIQGKAIQTLFPEAARRVALYLVDYISENIIKVKKDDTVYFSDDINDKYSFEKLKEITDRKSVV